MNTKRDFVRAAELIKQFKHYGIEDVTDRDIALMTTVFVLYFKLDNPDFDDKRFKEACSPMKVAK